MKKIFPAFILAALSLLTLSCVKERMTDNGIPNGADQAEVILRLKTPQGYSPARSRSLSYADENTIDDIWVLVFDKNNTLTAIKKGENVTSSEGSANPSYSGEGSFTVTLSPSGTTADTYNLVVLANAESIISGTIRFDVADISNNSYASVMAAINAEITGPMYPFGGVIPMWGESGQLVIQPGSNNQTLQLTRSVARIDVGVGKATKDLDDIWSWNGKDASEAPIPFELDHVYVIKPNKRYAVAPDASKAEGEPTVPAGTQPFPYDDSESNFGFAATGGHTSRDIYVPEADIKMSASASSGDANHTNRMAIVVGGRYNGSQTETFYRLDFAVGGDLVNVLRNHLYQFNISKVSGDGFPNVETAYNSLSMNMMVDIYEWNEKDMGLIVFDGQNYLSVSQDEFNFTRDEITEKEDNNVLFVKTDYTTTLGEQRSGWYVEKIEYADADNDEWITLSSDSGNAHEKSEVVLTVTENNSGDVRSAVIWIAAGRMRYSVTVTQSLTPALGIQLTDGNDKPVTELLFTSALDVQPDEQTIKVSWQPKTAVLSVTNTPVGTAAFEGSGIPDGNIDDNDSNNGPGKHTYTIQPAAITPTEIDPAKDGNPFLEKISKIDFTTTNGISYANKSIFLRQIHYNLLTDAQTSYVLGSEPQAETIHVRANFGWEIVDVEDEFDLLYGNDDALIGKTGGYNTTTGDEVSFTLDVASTDGSKMDEMATITFLSLVDGSEWEVTIKVIEYPYVGMFGGELKKNETTGVWQFTRPLYVQGEDETKGQNIIWSDSNFAQLQDPKTNYYDGRTNTFRLHTITSYSHPAATLCYNKNTSTIVDAEDLMWYLPAHNQLMAIWVVHESFSNNNKLNTTSTFTVSSSYWNSTQRGATDSWRMDFSDGISLFSSKGVAFSVRCVRED